MKTQAPKIAGFNSAIKPLVQRKNNARAVAPPTISPIKINDSIQLKAASSFSWMKSNNIVQQKTATSVVQPSRQLIVQPKVKPSLIQPARVIQPKIKIAAQPKQIIQPKLKTLVQLKQAIQPKIEIGQPNDHYEHEADTVALQVVNMPQPVSLLSHTNVPGNQTAQRKSIKPAIYSTNTNTVQAKQILHISNISQSMQMLAGSPTRAGPDTSPLDVESRLKSSSGRGSPLSEDVKNFFEPRFRADFNRVRIHTDAEAVSLNNRLGSIAFAHGSDIYFNANQYNFSSKEGKILIAHELTHVLQQGGAARRKIANITPAPISIQRSVVGEVLDWFADKANIIPGFRMFTIILGMNPINGGRVERSGANIIRAAIEFIPGGGLITQALDGYGIFEKAGAWIENEFAQLGMVGGAFKQALSDFIDSLGWSDLLPWNWGDVWNRAKRIFTTPIDKLISFAKGLLIGFIKIIKEAILRPIAKLAEGTRGYDLLKALLGEDPVTGDKVPQTADTLIGGFMKLIGQEEVWENIKKANAIPRAWAWFKNTMSSLVALMRQIPGRFVNAFKSLELMDIVMLPRAFIKVGSVFVGIVGDFLGWGLNAVWGLLQIIFEVVAPGVMPYIAKAQAAFRTIIKDPIRFVGNLVRAGKLGFEKFRNNFVKHLTTSLIKWITAPLGAAGVYIPKSFTLIEIIKLALSVIGLSWANIRVKLVKIIPEPILAGLEKTAGILVTLVTQGPVAAWEQIKAELTEFKNQAINQIIEMVTSEVVKAAVTKLLSFLNPAGAFVQAIIAIYNTVSFFVQKIREIAMVVAAFIDSISAIAAGVIDTAAQKVENTMANALTVVIAFLAKFAGLGNVPDKVVGIIKRLRNWVDKGIDKIVAWLREMLKKLKGDKKDERTDEQKMVDLKKAVTEGHKIASDKSVPRSKKLKGLSRIKKEYRLTSIDLVLDQQEKLKEKVHVHAVINPTYDGDGFVIDKFPPEPTVVIEAMVGAPLTVRPGMEKKVLESPGKAGLPGYQRAHLLGPGLGTDAPQGILYAPRDVNLKLQNAGIEHMIREMYAQRYPSAEFRVSLTAVPHPGSEILAKANYKLYGRLAGEPWTFIFEYTIRVGLGATATAKVLAGDADMAAVNRFSAGAAAVMSTRGQGDD